MACYVVLILQTISETSWFDLSQQSFQPVIFSSLKCLEYDYSDLQAKLAKLALSSKKPKQEEKPSCTLIGEECKVFYDTEVGFSGGGSLKLLNSKKRKDFEDPLTSSPMYVDDVNVSDRSPIQNGSNLLFLSNFLKLDSYERTNN